jgi:hypothetical protein
MIWKEAVMAYLKVLSQNSPKENHIQTIIRDDSLAEIWIGLLQNTGIPQFTKPIHSMNTVHKVKTHK